VNRSQTRRVSNEELAARAQFAILAAVDLEKKQTQPTYTAALLSDLRRCALVVAKDSCVKPKSEFDLWSYRIPAAPKVVSGVPSEFNLTNMID